MTRILIASTVRRVIAAVMWRAARKGGLSLP
jgi:hypothetical protein